MVTHTLADRMVYLTDLRQLETLKVGQVVSVEAVDRMTYTGTFAGVMEFCADNGDGYMFTIQARKEDAILDGACLDFTRWTPNVFGRNTREYKERIGIVNGIQTETKLGRAA